MEWREHRPQEMAASLPGGHVGIAGWPGPRARTRASRRAPTKAGATAGGTCDSAPSTREHARCQRRPPTAADRRRRARGCGAPSPGEDDAASRTRWHRQAGGARAARGRIWGNGTCRLRRPRAGGHGAPDYRSTWAKMSGSFQPQLLFGDTHHVDGRPRRLHLVRRQSLCPGARPPPRADPLAALRPGDVRGVRAYNTVSAPRSSALASTPTAGSIPAKIYLMDVPYSKEVLMEAQKEVVRVNKLEACYIRPVASTAPREMGVSPVGATVHVAIAAWPWGAYLGEEGIARHPRRRPPAMRATTSTSHHGAPSSPPPMPTRSCQPRGGDARLRRGPAARRRRICRRGRRGERVHRQGRG